MTSSITILNSFGSQSIDEHLEKKLINIRKWILLAIVILLINDIENASQEFPE